MELAERPSPCRGYHRCYKEGSVFTPLVDPLWHCHREDILYFSDRKFVTRHGRLARRTSGHSCHACSSTCEPILRDACTLSQKGNASIGSRIGEKAASCVVRVLLGHSQRLSRPYLAGNPRGYPHKCAIAGPIGSLSRITYVGEPITGEPIGKSRVTIKRPELTV